MPPGRVRNRTRPDGVIDDASIRGSPAVIPRGQSGMAASTETKAAGKPSPARTEGAGRPVHTPGEPAGQARKRRYSWRGGWETNRPPPVRSARPAESPDPDRTHGPAHAGLLSCPEFRVSLNDCRGQWKPETGSAGILRHHRNGLNFSPKS